MPPPQSRIVSPDWTAFARTLYSRSRKYRQSPSCSAIRSGIDLPTASYEMMESMLRTGRLSASARCREIRVFPDPLGPTSAMFVCMSVILDQWVRASVRGMVFAIRQLNRLRGDFVARCSFRGNSVHSTEKTMLPARPSAVRRSSFMCRSLFLLTSFSKKFGFIPSRVIDLGFVTISCALQYSVVPVVRLPFCLCPVWRRVWASSRRRVMRFPAVGWGDEAEIRGILSVATGKSVLPGSSVCIDIDTGNS